jgi:hypothetical protein
MCMTESELSCVDENYKLFQSDKFIQDNCLPECPLECNISNYLTTYSLSSFPTDMHLNIFNSNQALLAKYNANRTYSSLNELTDNLVKINIYYDKLTYTLIDEFETTTMPTLLSNIGGTLGLYLSVSVLSIVELIEVIIEFVTIQIRKRKKN